MSKPVYISVPKVLIEMHDRFPEVVGELLAQVMKGLPSFALTPAEENLPKKKRESRLKELEKEAAPAFARAIALAIEDGDPDRADDLLGRLDDKFTGLLITVEQLTSATIPLQIVVQIYIENKKLIRADVTSCKTPNEVIDLVLGTASGRL